MTVQLYIGKYKAGPNNSKERYYYQLFIDGKFYSSTSSIHKSFSSFNLYLSIVRLEKIRSKIRERYEIINGKSNHQLSAPIGETKSLDKDIEDSFRKCLDDLCQNETRINGKN